MATSSVQIKHPEPETTLELGTNVLVRLRDIRMATVQGDVLRLWLAGFARPEAFTHQSAAVAQSRYEFIREAMGFPAREDAG